MELNAAHNRNKLVELYNGLEKVMGNYIWREGHDLNTFYIIRWAGVDPPGTGPPRYGMTAKVISPEFIMTGTGFHGNLHHLF